MMWKDVENGINVFIKTSSQNVVPLRGLTPHDLIQTVKQRLELKTGLLGELMTLKFASKIPEDSDNLLQCNIKNGSVLRLIIEDNEVEKLFSAIHCGSSDDIFDLGIQYLDRNLAKNDTEKFRIDTWNNRACFKASIALCMLSAQGQLELVEAVLHKAAVNTNYQTTYGRSALHLAARSDQASVVNLLLGHGFDPCMTDCDGFTPMDIAKYFSSGHCERRLWLAQVNPSHPRPGSQHRQDRATYNASCGRTLHNGSPKDDLDTFLHNNAPAESPKQVHFPLLSKKMAWKYKFNDDRLSSSEEFALPNVDNGIPSNGSASKEKPNAGDKLKGGIPKCSASKIPIKETTFSLCPDNLPGFTSAPERPSTSNKILEWQKSVERQTDNHNLTAILMRYARNDFDLRLPKDFEDRRNTQGRVERGSQPLLMKESTPSQLKQSLVSRPRNDLIQSEGGGTNSRVTVVSQNNVLVEEEGRKDQQTKMITAWLDVTAKHECTPTLQEDEKTQKAREKTREPDEISINSEENSGKDSPRSTNDKTVPDKESASFKLNTVNSREPSNKSLNMDDDILSSHNTNASSLTFAMVKTSEDDGNLQSLMPCKVDDGKVSFEQWLIKKRAEGKLLFKRTISETNHPENKSERRSVSSNSSEAFENWLATKKRLDKRHSITVCDNNVTNNTKKHFGMKFEDWLETKKTGLRRIDVEHQSNPVTQRIQVRQSGLSYEEWLKKKTKEKEKDESDDVCQTFKRREIKSGLSFKQWLDEKDKISKIELIRRATIQEANQLKDQIDYLNRLSSPKVKTFKEWILMKNYEYYVERTKMKSKAQKIKNPKEDSKLIYDMWMLNKHMEEMEDEDRKISAMREEWEKRRKQQTERASRQNHIRHSSESNVEEEVN